MAVDSALKRSSATDLLMPYRGWVYPSGSDVGQAEKQAASFCYSGILAAVPIVGYLAVTWDAKAPGFEYESKAPAFVFVPKAPGFEFTNE